MSEQAESTVAILNELLRAEKASLTGRLAETKPFVARKAGSEGDVIAGVFADQAESVGALTGAILELGGWPETSLPDASLGHLHYLDIDYLLPRLIADQRAVVGVYEHAAERMGAGPTAMGALVDRLLGRHRGHLAGLEGVLGSSEIQS